jgi:prevent-host-death family protein
LRKALDGPSPAKLLIEYLLNPNVKMLRDLEGDGERGIICSRLLRIDRQACSLEILARSCHVQARRIKIMPSVALSEAKDHLSEFVAAAERGEEIIITRHGKPAARLVAIDDGKRALHREAIRGLFAVGRTVFDHHGATSREEIRDWLEEDRA